MDLARKPLRSLRRNGDETTIWALKHLDFEIAPGEAVGIIGRNGAGKSTLLKILSRITEPTVGRAELYGRVASLLEVGTGFHPELTGRENIFLNGSILGMSRKEIESKFDEIVAFAEVEKFIDTPVKRYSSGMYVRLAFGVAAHLEPEILIVDEVLAVGDAAFQKKCIGKMGEVAKQGRTVLLVSHTMSVISALATRCLVLAEGRCIFEGDVEQGVKLYAQPDSEAPPEYDAPISDHPKVIHAEVITSMPGGVHVVGEPLEIRIRLHTPSATVGHRFSFQVRNSLGQHVMHLWSNDDERPMLRTPGIYEMVCKIPV